MATVTLQQAKEWLRVDFDDDDDLIQGLIDAAEGWVETYTCHVLSPKDVVLKGRNGVCSDYCYLYPINNIPEEVVYETYSLFTQIYLRKGESTTINVGYTNVADIPKQLLTAVKKLVTYWYEQRDVYTVELPNDVQILVNQLRRAIAVV